MRSLLRIIKTLTTFLCLVVIILFPSEYKDPETSAATKDEILDAHVRIDVEWNNYNPGNGNISQTGSFFVEVRGTIIRTPDRDPFSYSPKNLVANYNYSERSVYVRPSGRCPELYSEQKGSGVVRILDTDEVEDPTKDGVLTITAGSGWEQSLSLLKELKGKGRTPGLQKPIDKELKTDIYTFVLTVPMATTLTEQSNPCSRYKTSPWPTGVGLNAYMNLTKWGMYGSYSWTSNTLDTGLQIRDYPNQTQFEPQKGEGNVKYRVSWNFGKIKPMIQIFRITDEGREDITDAKSMKVPVIVGEKVVLEAEALPHGTEVTNGEWKINEKKVIAGYKANAQKGEVLNLTEEDYKKKKIEFYWIDGSFSGIPENITYSADSKLGKVEGKTIITVFEPSVKMEIKSNNPHIDLWPVGIGQCRLYLGDRSKLPTDKELPKEPISDEKAKQINKKAAKDAAGIFIDSTITLPRPFANQNHSLEYIQLIKELILETQDTRNYSTRADTWLCDKNYPYANKVAEKNIYMDDSPGSPLHQLTHQLSQYQTFQTFLMFRPCPLSKAQNDENSVWVPLKFVEWKWKASAKRLKPYSNNNYALPEEFRRTDFIVPSPTPKEKDWTGPPNLSPQWNGNAEPEKDRRKQINQTTDKDQTAWQKLLGEFGEIGSKK